MAESVVSLLIERLATSIEQKANLLHGVTEELIAIKNELQIIRAVLRDADAKSQSDEAVKEWVNQVRDLAQEIESLLDEHEAETQGSCMGRMAKFFKCVESTSDYHIAPRIQVMKARIEQLSDRRQRYNFSNSEQQSSASCRVGTKMRDPREDALFLGDAQVVGISGPRDRLITFLLAEDPRLRVVSVYGMGGLGKTTLAKKVYDNQEVKYGFPDYRAWITVSQSFDPNGLLKSVLRQLFGVVDGVDKMEAMEMKQTLYDKLLGKRYVVVLDDIWDSNAWKGLKNALPDDNSGSRIIVTTRLQNIAAETCIDCYGLQYKLEPLNLEDSWKLFYKKASKSDVRNMTFDPDHISMDPCSKFLNKCKGLPLGIVAIGGLLSTKRTSEWDQVYRSLGALMDGSNGSAFDDLQLVISYSYTDLPDHLKSCFLYMSIFPEDYPIKCSNLLRLWAAEGFVVESRRPGMNFTKEEIANSYLEELTQRSLVQVDARNDSGRVTICKLHDLIREFIINVANRENFAAFISEEQNTSRSSRQPPRLSYDTEISGQSSESDIRLRSLIVFRGFQPSFTFSRFKLLKVLDVQYCPYDNLPNEIGNLMNLRYLSLSKHGAPVNVSFGKLVHLETLDLKGCFVRDCDFTGIVKMTQLRHLMFGGHSDFRIVDMPEGIHKLVALETLGVLNLNVEGSGILTKELGNMTQLRKLSVCGLLKEDQTQLFASVEKLKFLRTFKVSPLHDEFVYSGSLSSPSTSLRSLFIRGTLIHLPSWISLLPNLEKIVLEESKLIVDPMETLEQLPNLVTLTFHNAFSGKKLNISEGGFPKLEKLRLILMSNLSEVRVKKGGMPAIQSITFQAHRRRRRLHQIRELPLLLEQHAYMPDIINL